MAVPSSTSRTPRRAPGARRRWRGRGWRCRAPSRRAALRTADPRRPGTFHGRGDTFRGWDETFHGRGAPFHGARHRRPTPNRRRQVPPLPSLRGAATTNRPPAGSTPTRAASVVSASRRGVGAGDVVLRSRTRRAGTTLDHDGPDRRRFPPPKAHVRSARGAFGRSMPSPSFPSPAPRCPLGLGRSGRIPMDPTSSDPRETLEIPRKTKNPASPPGPCNPLHLGAL